MRPLATAALPLLLGALLARTAPSPAAADEPRRTPAPAPGFVGFHVEPMALLSAEQKAALGAAGDRGVVVALIVPHGPADAAGLRVGDFLLRFAGHDVPQPAWTDRYDPRHHEWRVAVRTLLASVTAGAAAEAVVERGGKRATLSLVPATEEAMHVLQGGTDAPLPRLDEAGPASALAVDFEGAGTEAKSTGRPLPAGFFPHEGRWGVVPDPAGKRENSVLRQDLPVLPWAALVVAGRGRAYADGTASVRFLPVSGVADASGGVVFRAQGGKDYYLARANALEDNFGLYLIRNNVRTELKSVRVTPPALGKWHSIEVRFEGPSIRATLDGKDPVEATDPTYASGWCGVWTKADSVTLFDDLSVTPAAR